MIDKCPNKNECGSCEWSEIPYKDQLKNKLNLINAGFLKNGFSDKVTEIKSSPKTSHYRNRMDFVIDYRGNFGLRQKSKWWKVIDNHTCFIADEKIEKAFHVCYGWIKSSGLSFWDRKTYKGLLSYIVLRTTLAADLMVNVVTSSDYSSSDEPLITEKLRLLSKITSASTLVWSTNHSKSDVSYGDEIKIISGSGYIEEVINGYKYRITPNSFFQTNSHAAKTLQDVVIKFAKKTKATNILDLYCGSGFFTLPLAKITKKVIGIEVIEEAVDSAKINAKINKYSAEFLCTKSEELDWQNLSPQLVVLDPPRSGLHPKVLKEILERKPTNIIYVSCNFSKFTEEYKQLNSIYKISSSVAVDMLPHTHHVELVSLLTKK